MMKPCGIFINTYDLSLFVSRVLVSLLLQAQRQERARERLHASCATTIQKFWRGRCVGEAQTNSPRSRFVSSSSVKVPGNMGQSCEVLNLPKYPRLFYLHLTCVAKKKLLLSHRSSRKENDLRQACTQQGGANPAVNAVERGFSLY